MNTDFTMSYAKQISPERTRYVVCSNDTAERIRRESQLRRDLPKALKKGEFFLTYQPIIDLKQSIISGAEVLVRWQHPTFGTVSPFDFIELAERSGEIIPLGIWILREACI